VVLLILAVVWALYLASWLRNRAHTRSSNSISSFNQHLSVLQRTNPVAASPSPSLRPVRDDGSVVRTAGPTYVHREDPLVRTPEVRGLLSGAPISRGDARRRRRHILVTLLLLATASTVVSVVAPGFLTFVCLSCWALLTTYVFFLVRAQKLAYEQEEKVYYLHQAAAPAADPTMMLQRSAR
jgi:hypothetical protein